MLKITYIGIIILVMALAVIAFGVIYGSGSIMKAAGDLVVIKNITVLSNSSTNLSFNTTGSPLIFSVLSEADINFYIMNSTAYSIWGSTNYTETNPNGLLRSESLEGSGTVVIYQNSMNVSFPTGMGQKPIYEEYGNSTYTNITNSTYYLVIDNTNGSASSSNDVNVRVVYLPSINLNNATTYNNYNNFENSLNKIRMETIIAVILLIAGGVVVVYGVVRNRRDKNRKNNNSGKRYTSEEDIDKLYERAEVRSRKPIKNSRPRTTKRVRKRKRG